NFNARKSRLHAAVLETNSTIVAGGASDGVSRDFALTRFVTTQSALDNGTNGTITVNGGGCLASANAEGSSALLLLLMLVIVWHKRKNS
ncbi:MAG: hypothetical protein ACOC24_06955, partial [Desulfovibrionales bacterium]